MKLILRLLAGILVGALIGTYAPEAVTRGLITLKLLLGGLIGYLIPLIILFFIGSGISSLGKSSGRLLAAAVGLSYTSTIVAGLLAFTVGTVAIPMLTAPAEMTPDETKLAPFFRLEIAPLMGVITALATAFLLGLGVAYTQSPTLRNVLDEGKRIVELAISAVVLPILPVYVGCIFAELAAEDAILATLTVFVAVLAIVVVTQWAWLLMQYSVAAAVARRNPLVLLKNMLPAYFTAIGTMSSAATIPVTLRSVKKNCRHENIVDFGVPLCATIHLSGSMITIVLCSLAVMTRRLDLAMPSLGQMLPAILLLGLIMIAAPGVPGGAIMAAAGALTAVLGFSADAIGLMMALYAAQDSFGTATNVTGDGAINQILDHMAGEIDREPASPNS
ncbi:MAG: cation:dicarboxylase symporter family transporter [Patescibacteria group bacterium]|nr:cation:dicarboxylase symporter family transporter [Patescibacteria group bacterium]